MKKFNILIISPSFNMKIGGTGGLTIVSNVMLQLFKNDKIFKLKQISTRGNIFLFSPFIYLLSLLKIFFFVVFDKIDLAHVHISQQGSSYRKILICILLKFFKIPYILHLHGSKFHHFYNDSSILTKNLIFKIFNESQANIVLGEFWKKFLENKVKVKKNVFILYNTSIFKSKFKIKNSKQLNILFLGRLSRRKGTYDLIKALNKIKNYNNWYAKLVGDGDINEINNLISKLNLRERIEVTGWKNRQQINKYLLVSNIFILPSYDENLPLSVIEAMACGIPVITTPVGALPEIVKHNYNGILVKPGNISGISKNIKFLLKSKKLRDKIGKNAQIFFSKKLNDKSFKKNLIIIWRKKINEK